MARKSIGEEPRKTTSIRIEPKRLVQIVKKHGSLQKWLDACLDKELPRPKKVKLSKQDF